MPLTLRTKLAIAPAHEEEGGTRGKHGFPRAAFSGGNGGVR